MLDVKHSLLLRLVLVERLLKGKSSRTKTLFNIFICDGDVNNLLIVCFQSN